MKNKSNFFKKRYWMRIAICLLLLGTISYLIIDHFHEKNIVSQVCNGKICFTVELARSLDEQHLGLMHRPSLAEKSGMLFIFPKFDLHDFWMKNTLIPLDMIWIDDQFKVVRVMTAQPCRADPCEIYSPDTFAKYVLEINAGIAQKYWISEWTTVKFKNVE